ncbi:MAG: ABC transporter ATP-binding protein [Proteobacteria bacterium]|nr:ABC transporter ATP-binding protein [Pseudomonadota bacterium]
MAEVSQAGDGTPPGAAVRAAGMAQTKEALCVTGLSVSRGSRRIVHGIDLSIRYGEVFAVVGPNGAGKSTLLRAVCGLLPYSGSVSISGTRLDGLSLPERARRLALVPQHTSLRSALPVRSVVLQGRYAHRGGLARWRAQDYQRSEEAMKRVDVARFASRPFTRLSFGEQRRVMLARVLATGARILCFDEPTASLDVAHALRFYELLGQLASEGRCVLVVLHQLSEVLRYSQRALLLHYGRPVAIGASEQVLSGAAVRQVYGVELLAGAGLGYRLVDKP